MLPTLGEADDEEPGAPGERGDALPARGCKKRLGDYPGDALDDQRYDNT